MRDRSLQERTPWPGLRHQPVGSAAFDLPAGNLPTLPQVAYLYPPRNLGTMIDPSNFTSRNWRRQWLGLEEISRPMPIPPLKDWHPAFGTLRAETRSYIYTHFTEKEYRRMAFVSYMARNYYINEG